MVLTRADRSPAHHHGESDCPEPEIPLLLREKKNSETRYFFIMSLSQHRSGTEQACPEDPHVQGLDTWSSRPQLLHTKTSPFFISPQFAMVVPPFRRKRFVHSELSNWGGSCPYMNTCIFSFKKRRRENFPIESRPHKRDDWHYFEVTP